MKANLINCLRVLPVLCGFVFAGLCQCSFAAEEGQVENKTDELVAASSRALVELLRTGDATGFARAMAPTPADYRSVASTNPAAITEGGIERWDKIATNQFGALELSAKTLVDRMKSMHLDFSKSDIEPRLAKTVKFSRMSFQGIMSEKERLPRAEKLTLAFSAAGGAAGDTNGEFQISFDSCTRFPSGWRCSGGVEWEAFPAGVADEKTLREMALLTKAKNYQGITDKDDPALRGLAELLLQFLRERDLNLFQQNALVSEGALWNQLNPSIRASQSRENFSRSFAKNTAEQVDAARAVLAQLDAAGINFKDAELKPGAIMVGRIMPRGNPNSVEGLGGGKFTMNFTVDSKSKAATGAPVSGEYVLSAGDIMRFDGRWSVMANIRWEKFPPGVLDEKSAKALEFENYVAEHRALPPGTEAPEIEFTTVDGGRKFKLSDFRGKVVVLDFWATWCGPCQQPMADLQKLRLAHDDWQGRVEIMPLSIDDTVEAVRQHLAKRGWTNTFNVWAGGGWKSSPPTTYHVTGIPTTYIIGADGKIAASGHPVTLKFEQIITKLLDEKKS